jgi:hypothetical protein
LMVRSVAAPSRVCAVTSVILGRLVISGRSAARR